MTSFVYPFLFFLLPLPLLARLVLPSVEKQQQDALKVPFYAEMEKINADSSAFVIKGNLVKRLLVWTIWGLLVCAAAQPRWVGKAVKMPSEGRNLMVVLDISGSMQEADFVIQNQAVRRWDAVQAVANNFIQKRTGDKVGVVLFGEQAYLYTPLTYDIPTVSELLAEADVGMAGTQTAIGDALGLALKTMIDVPAKSKVIVLLSDGVANAGAMKPLEAAELAKKMGVKVYTIGAGSDTVEMQGLFGLMSLSRADEIDEKTLKEIANKTGGLYFRAKNTKDLLDIYSEIDDLEPVENESVFVRPVKALFYYPLALAFLLSLITVIPFLLKGRK